MDEIRKQKILLVEDNEMVRIYFREIFWIHGLENKYELQVIESVDKAITLLDIPGFIPDIIFLGLVMPMNFEGRMITTPEAGFSLLKKIKADPKFLHTKVIIFTGHDSKEYQEKAKQLGADAYLVKHENMPQELVQFVEHLK